MVTADTTGLLFFTKEIFNWLGTAICGVLFLRLLVAARTPWAALFPLLYMYGVMTCPKRDSFDTKKELKRVLRGHHLAADDPRKPQSFLGSMASRAAASVVTESVTMLTGYRRLFWSLGAAAWLVTLDFPDMDGKFYVWIGFGGTWYYVTNNQQIELWIDHFR